MEPRLRDAMLDLPPDIDEGALFRSLFLAYPDALLLVGRDGRIALANPAASTLLGYSTAELAGLNVDALVPEGIRPRHASYREAYNRAPRARPMGTQTGLVAKRRDGTEVMVEIALSPLPSHGLPLVVAAIRDVGDYPRVKEALRRARYSEYLAKLGRLAVDSRDPQVLLEQVPAIAAEAFQVEVAAVFLLDDNRLAFRIASGIGLARGEAVGTRIPNRVDTPPGFVLSQGRPIVVADYRAETRFLVPRAYVDVGLVSALAVPLSDRGRIVGVLTVRSHQPKRFGDDEIRFLESLSNLLASGLQRAQGEEALNHAQRLESVGQLTGGIAHDFNNLLTVILGNLHVLEELPDLAQHERAQQLVGAATRASRRGAELTGKLLAFSRRQVLQPMPTDVGLLLSSLADMLRRTLDQRIRIEIDAAPACPPVLADPGQLESALLNIAINARDAMPDGGLLRFRCAAHGALPAEIHRELGDPQATGEHFVAISVADSGTGMSDEVRERAFEPFFTTKEAGRGTGLGLSTVYGFVKQSRGAVAIDSSPGLGTTVTLYIPRPQQSRKPALEEPDIGLEPVPPGLRVLLVEDDAEVGQVVHRFLEALGCVVTTAGSGEQALLALVPDGAFEAMVSDIALGPRMRGTQLAAEAARRLPRLAIVLMSGFSADLLDADRDCPPEWALLQKPFGQSELSRALATALAGRDAS